MARHVVGFFNIYFSLFCPAAFAWSIACHRPAYELVTHGIASAANIYYAWKYLKT